MGQTLCVKFLVQLIVAVTFVVNLFRRFVVTFVVTFVINVFLCFDSLRCRFWQCEE
jgi:hypothetical protein